jgi:16S rRNA (cytosine967-C5)-methyltransferase
MTPAARVAAALELLAKIEALDRPADGIVRGYLRERRYIGSKDRRAITDLVYGVLRAQARLDWWVARLAPEAGGARARVLAALVMIERRPAEQVAALFDGGRYHPDPLESEEDRLLAALAGLNRAGLARAGLDRLDHPEQPQWVRGEQPPWLLARLAESFGDDLESELAALLREAPLDLRVNTLKTDRETARAALAAEGIEAAPTPLSPLGLRVAGRHTLPSLRAFRDGLVEVQDEGSQLVALLTGARPGLAVADLCAGAGGKTLALAAAMGDEGRLVALDSEARRLQRAGPRLARAGAAEVELRPLTGADDPWLAENAGAFERVLLDAPCSGSGAWRRHPDARWRLSEAQLTGYLELQREILERAAPLVAPAGRLVYATCSLLPEENGAQVARFLEAHDDFAPLPIAEVWAEAIGTPCPGEGRDLLLSPARHGTDGFFLAVLERRAQA